LNVPALTLAVQADEFRAIRARAIAAGGTPDIPEAPRNVLANLLRGRIEDIAGWARFNQDKVDEAVDHLKRAVTILPEGTPAARTSLWHLGAALDRQDKKAEALSYYIKSYNSGEPDAVRRTVIEQLYRKVNGSLAGLDERIGPAVSAPVSVQTTASENTPTATPAAVTPVAEASPTPASEPSATPSLSPSPETPIATPQPTPSAESPSPAPEQSPTPASNPSPEAPSVSTPQPTPGSPTPSPSSPTPNDPGALPATSPTPPVETTSTPFDTATKPRATVTITGRVKDASDNPLANVVVVLISPQGTVLAATTDDQGNYSFTLAPSSSPRSYRLIPSKDGLTFEPVDRVLPIVSDEVKELNFVGAPVKQSVRLQ
jgi:hypothetical protein